MELEESIVAQWPCWLVPNCEGGHAAVAVRFRGGHGMWIRARGNNL